MNNLIAIILGFFTVVVGSVTMLSTYLDYHLTKKLQKPSSSSVAQRLAPTVPGQPNLATENDQWGVAQKIGEHTYSIRVGQDDRMATAPEILTALNSYRQSNGQGTLNWDDKLAQEAQSRTDYFKSRGSTDAHAGFNDFLDNQDGFNKLGFNRLGENSYFGGPLYGVHLIEWVFAKSPGHNANQLDGSWSHVGIGVNDTAVNLIFGGKKI